MPVDWKNIDLDKKKDQKLKRRKLIIYLLAGIIFPAFFYLKQNMADFYHNIADRLFQPEEFEYIKPIYDDKPLSDFFPTEVQIEETIDLQKIFIQNTEALQGEYGIYFLDLASGSEITLNADNVFDAASVVKIVPMALAYKLLENGQFDLEEKYTLKTSDVQAYGTGSMQYQKIGTIYTYGEVLELAGKKSDNTADHILRQKLGAKALTEFLLQLEMTKTDLENVKSTPREIGIFFQKIHKLPVLTQKIKNMFYDNLTDTDFEDRIPAGIPNEIRVVHKIGNGFNRAYNDCGIVFSPRPFVICIMSQSASETEAMAVIPKIARASFEWSISKN